MNKELQQAINDCLRHPDHCESLADYMHDMGNDARKWLAQAKRFDDVKDIEICEKLVMENDLCERLLRALAKAGVEN